MKTIEERINEISIEIGCNCADFYSHEIDFNVIEDGLMQIAADQKVIDFAMFQSFLSERGLLFGKYTKANGDTGYKTLDELWEFFNKEEEKK